MMIEIKEAIACILNFNSIINLARCMIVSELIKMLIPTIFVILIYCGSS